MAMSRGGTSGNTLGDLLGAHPVVAAASELACLANERCSIQFSLRGAGSTPGGAAPESQTNSIEAQIRWLTDLIRGIFLYEFRREQCATKLCDDHTLG